MNYAVIDIGSNTMRLCVFQVSGDAIRELFHHKATVGLAGYVDEGALSQAGIDAACRALNKFRHILNSVQVEKTAIFATASLRNVSNTEAAVAAIREQTGFEVQVISGVEEAILDYKGVIDACDDQSGVIVDIGGGSTEVTFFESAGPRVCNSFPVGSLNLYRTCVEKEILPNRKEQKLMRAKVSDVLGSKALGPIPQGLPMMAVGGSARAALRLANAHLKLDRDNRCLTQEQLGVLTDALLERDKKAVDLVIRHCPSRIHTIVPGLMILKHLCAQLDSSRIQVCANGVREGYVRQFMR